MDYNYNYNYSRLIICHSLVMAPISAMKVFSNKESYKILCNINLYSNI